MNVKNFFAILPLLLNSIKTINTTSHSESFKTNTLSIVNFDSVSLPSNFMIDFDERILTNLSELSSNSFDGKNKHTETDLIPASETSSVKDLISSIKIYIDKKFSFKKGKYSHEIYQAKSIIDSIIDMLSEIDSTIQSTNSLTIPNENLKVSVLDILKQLIFYFESRNIDNLGSLTKKKRLILLRNLLQEIKICLISFYKSLNEYQKIEDIVAIIEEFSSNTTTCKNTAQAKKISEKQNEKSYNANSAIHSENNISKVMPSSHLFTCKNPYENNYCLVRSFCKSNTGVWYFAITHTGSRNFYILKINQNDFDKNNSHHEIIKEYSILSENKIVMISFSTYCRKICINSSETLYVLKYDIKYTSFEILALDSNFRLIKKFENFSFNKYNLQEPFIEDIEIYDDSLYMLDSVNECIIVTGFDFNVKNIIKVVDIKFEDFKEIAGKKLKIKISLLVTEESFYIYFVDKLFTCKNTLKSNGKSRSRIIEKASQIYIQEPCYVKSFESIAYIGNDSFISLPNWHHKYFIISRLIPDSVPLTCDSETKLISLVPRGRRNSYEMTVMEDFTVYMVEGGTDIRLYKIDYKSSTNK